MKKIKKNSILKNYIFNSTYKLLNICMPLITAPYLSRVFGAELLGEYSYYYAIAHYFYLFGKMGLNNYGTRQIAAHSNSEHEKNQVFSSIYLQQIITSLCMIIVYIIFCLYQSEKNSIVPIILGVYVIGCLFDIDWVYCGLEQFDRIAIKNILVKILTLFGIFFFVKSEKDLGKYTLIMALGMLVGFISLWSGIKNYVSWTKISLKSALKHIKPNFILLFPVLAINIYRSMDKVMVGNISGMAELGYYENAEKIIYAISGFITAFTNIMMPRCTKLIAQQNYKKCKQSIDYSIHFLFFFIGGMGFGCFALAKHIVLIVYGSKFVGSILLLQLLSFSLLPMILSEVIRAMWIIPQKRDNIFLYAMITGAIINLLTNSILIPILGASGACVATVFAEVSVALVQFYLIRNEVDYSMIFKNAIIYISAGIMMVLIIMNTHSIVGMGISSLILLVLTGGVFYIIFCLLLLKIFRKDLVFELKKIITSKLALN